MIFVELDINVKVIWKNFLERTNCNNKPKFWSIIYSLSRVPYYLSPPFDQRLYVALRCDIVSQIYVIGVDQQNVSNPQSII